MADLWEALGRPPLQGLVPPASTASWRSRSGSRASALGSAGCYKKVRSPAGLWGLLHGTPVPDGLSWGTLVRDFSVIDLVRAIDATRKGWTKGIVTWNARWLIDPDSQQNHDKRNRIRRWLDAGRIVLLQETHWSTSDSSVWDRLFPGATVRASPAVGGAGGVAILVPASLRLTEAREIEPGYAIAARVADGAEEVRCVSMYLPPGHRGWDCPGTPPTTGGGAGACVDHQTKPN